MEAQFARESLILTKSAFQLSPKQLVKVTLENCILLSAMICFRTASKVQPLSTRANVDLPSIRMFTYCNLLMKNSGGEFSVLSLQTTELIFTSSRGERNSFFELCLSIFLGQTRAKCSSPQTKQVTFFSLNLGGTLYSVFSSLENLFGFLLRFPLNLSCVNSFRVSFKFFPLVTK